MLPDRYRSGSGAGAAPSPLHAHVEGFDPHAAVAIDRDAIEHADAIEPFTALAWRDQLRKTADLLDETFGFE